MTYDILTRITVQRFNTTIFLRTLLIQKPWFLAIFNKSGKEKTHRKLNYKCSIYPVSQ